MPHACMQTTDESMVPLLINCWPSASGGESYVNIEYESTTDFDLQNVAIAIPLPAMAATPKVNQVYPCDHNALFGAVLVVGNQLPPRHQHMHQGCTVVPALC